MRSFVFVNDSGNPQDVELSFPGVTSPRPLVVWQPAVGPVKRTLPAKLTIPGDQCAIVTEEAAFERLGRIAPGAAGRRAAAAGGGGVPPPGDLLGWSLQGEAFSVCSMPSLFRRCTLNSGGKAGEAATGVATSPPVVIGPEFDRLEIVFHGGRSTPTDHGLNLALRAIDAATGRILLDLAPPGTHVLTTQTAAINGLRGKTVRFQLIDENTASSYAWIGLRKITLVASKR